ncbi:hypothetical protein FQN53_009614 [Emmonsiellopsis sp. PD_33]|nr:hypothetical protein FQN53_009614 [Emmonsiellopsis sp. PD_33]
MASTDDSPPISVDSETEYSDQGAYEEDLSVLTLRLRSTFAQSLISSVVNYNYENGRRYHTFREGAYIFPNDEKESNRLDIVHHMMTMLCDERLHLAPIGPRLLNILDIGSGTGLWCCQMGDEYPSAEILGVDLSATQPIYGAPDNVRFEIDDVESDWTFINTFDYIHCRYMYASIIDWPRLVRQCFNHVAPNGWAEFQDFDVEWYSDDGTYDRESALGRWFKLFHEAAAQHGRELSPGPSLEGWVRDAGFKDVVVRRIRVPVGRWPKDERLKTVGTWNLLQVIDGMEGFSMALFSRILGWSPDAIQNFVAEVVKDLRNPKMHAQFDL